MFEIKLVKEVDFSLDSSFWSFSNYLDIPKLDGMRVDFYISNDEIFIYDEKFNSILKTFYSKKNECETQEDFDNFYKKYKISANWNELRVLMCDLVDIEETGEVIRPFLIEFPKMRATLKKNSRDYDGCIDLSYEVNEHCFRVLADRDNIFEFYDYHLEHFKEYGANTPFVQFIDRCKNLLFEKIAFFNNSPQHLLTKKYFKDWAVKTIEEYGLNPKDFDFEDNYVFKNSEKDDFTHIIDEKEKKIFFTVRKIPLKDSVTNKFLNDDTKIPFLKLTTSDFPDFWCYRNYFDRFDKTTQSQLRYIKWNSVLEDCFIDFGDEDDDRAVNKKKEIVNFPADSKPFYFSLYKLELILIDDVYDEVREKLYVADPQKLNYLVKSFLRVIPLDYPYDEFTRRDDRREDILKKGDRSNNIHSFLEFHFGYFNGYKEDFINNLIEITKDIWSLRTRDNQFRRELLNEWIEEKIEEHNLDRSKLGLVPVITPEPPHEQEDDEIQITVKPTKKEVLLYFEYTEFNKTFETKTQMFLEISRLFSFSPKSLKGADNYLAKKRKIYLSDSNNLERIKALLEGNINALKRLNDDLV